MGRRCKLRRLNFDGPIQQPNWNQWWAKGPRDNQTEGESLAAHTQHVINGVRALHDRNTQLAQAASEPQFWHQMLLAAGLHDLGKTAPGFQLQLREKNRRFGHRHEILSLAWLDWALGCESKETKGQASAHRNIACAIASHHRDYSSINEKYKAINEADLREFLQSQPNSLWQETGYFFLKTIVPMMQASGFWDDGWCVPSEASAEELNLKHAG